MSELAAHLVDRVLPRVPIRQWVFTVPVLVRYQLAFGAVLRYRIEGDEVVTTVDASWNEAWNGTEQRRKFRFEGDRLIIELVPAPSLLFPGKVDYRRIVWEREDSNTA